MFPVLFSVPEASAWIAALALFALGGLFAWFGRKAPADKGSWWLAGLCGAGAIAVLAYFGTAGKIGPLPIRMFGVLVILGFLAGARAASARNKRLGLLGGDESFDLAFNLLLVGIVGARIVHVAQNMGNYEGRPLEMFKIWDGGLVWYGGAIAATLWAWWSLARRKRDIWAVSDSLALGVTLGHAIGRLGCFAAGCDYGKRVPVAEGETAPWWAVSYPKGEMNPKIDNILVPPEMRYDAENDLDVYLHPTQLYLVLFNLACFAILLFVDRKLTKGAFPGRLAAMYLMLYAVGRATLETFRGDEDRGVYFGGALSFSQVVSVLVFFGGFALWRALRSRRGAASSPPAAPAAPAV